MYKSVAERLKDLGIECNAKTIKEDIKDKEDKFVKELMKENKEIAMSYQSNLVAVTENDLSKDTILNSVEEQISAPKDIKSRKYRSNKKADTDENGMIDIYLGDHKEIKIKPEDLSRNIDADHIIPAKKFIDDKDLLVQAVRANDGLEATKEAFNSSENVVFTTDKINRTKGGQLGSECENLSVETRNDYKEFEASAMKALANNKKANINYTKKAINTIFKNGVLVIVDSLVQSALNDLAETTMTKITEYMIKYNSYDYTKAIKRSITETSIQDVYESLVSTAGNLKCMIPSTKELLTILVDVLVSSISKTANMVKLLCTNICKFTKISVEAVKSLFKDKKGKHESDKGIFKQVLEIVVDCIKISVMSMLQFGLFLMTIIGSLLDAMVKIVIFAYLMHVDIKDKHGVKAEECHKFVMGTGMYI